MDYDYFGIYACVVNELVGEDVVFLFARNILLFSYLIKGMAIGFSE